MLGLAAAIIIEAGLKIFRAYLMSWAATKQSYKSDLDAVSRVLHAPVDEFEKVASNVWMDRLEALNQFNAFTTGQSRLVLLDLPFVAIYLGVIFLVGGSLGFVLVAMVGLFVALVVLRARSLRLVLEERNTQNSKRDDFITESLDGIATVKSMAMEPQMQRRFERLQQASAAISHRHMSLSNELQIYSSLLGNSVLISIVSVGAIMAIQGIISIGTLACCTLLTSRVMQPVMRGIQVLMELENAQLSRERSRELFKLPHVPVKQKKSGKRGRGDISLRNVRFTCPNDNSLILNNLSLRAAPGEIIGIRGERDCGKSALLKMISGEISPSTGSCRIDGRKISDPDNAKLVNTISYVSQETTIFEGSIMDNITMFRRGPIIDHARMAARLINLEDDIHRLPKGYDTKIGQGITDVLPGGMVQRIVIARALAFEPSILLFDEANSLLDMRSDAALKAGLNALKGKMTIILISNRPSLLAIADKRYVLENGTLVVDKCCPGGAQSAAVRAGNG